MPEIKQLALGSLSTNCYIVWDSRDKNNAVIIDPADSYYVIERFLTDKSLTPVAILITHAHSDHTGAVARLKDGFPNIRVFVHEDDADFCEEVALSGARALYEPFPVDERVKDGDEIKIGVMTFRVVHTPGHSRGSVLYVIGNAMFSGDTLFAGSVGRVDLPGGDPAAQRVSLRRIAAMPGDYDVYPGHDVATTLERERAENVYLDVV
ncbi:MBL fold hydrolase [Clostridia bacterium]|nr:MBL fold hydrolase [Clostridia bacterium]